MQDCFKISERAAQILTAYLLFDEFEEARYGRGRCMPRSEMIEWFRRKGFDWNNEIRGKVRDGKQLNTLSYHGQTFYYDEIKSWGIKIEDVECTQISPVYHGKLSLKDIIN